MAWRLDLLDRFRQPERTGGGSGIALFHRLHWVLLGLSAATVFVVVLGSYGLRCFRQSPTNSVFLVRQELAAEGQFDRSPLRSGWRSIAMSKSMALMMPSPNSSWISSFQVVP